MPISTVKSMDWFSASRISTQVDPELSVRDATLAARFDEAPYAPVPLVGQPALDLFGAAVIGALYPRIGALLGGIYADRPENADEALEFSTAQAGRAADATAAHQSLAAHAHVVHPLGAALCTE